MSAIGKVFLIVNLILAALFLGWASTSLAKGSTASKDLVAEKSAHEATKKGLEDQVSQLRTDLAEAQKAKEAALAKAEVNAQEARDAKASLETESRSNADMRANLAKLQSGLEDYNRTNARLEQEKSGATEARNAAEKARDEAIAEREAAIEAQRAAETARTSAEGQVASLEKQITTARKEIEQLDTKLKTLKDITGVAEVTPVKKIDGRVMQVDFGLKPGLVALNVGADQGVTKGTTFEIYSGSTYKGQVRVETVQANHSAALITNPVPGTTIGQGDSATTRL